MLLAGWHRPRGDRARSIAAACCCSRWATADRATGQPAPSARPPSPGVGRGGTDVRVRERPRSLLLPEYEPEYDPAHEPANRPEYEPEHEPEYEQTYETRTSGGRRTSWRTSLRSVHTIRPAPATGRDRVTGRPAPIMCEVGGRPAEAGRTTVRLRDRPAGCATGHSALTARPRDQWAGRPAPTARRPRAFERRGLLLLALGDCRPRDRTAGAQRGH